MSPAAVRGQAADAAVGVARMKGVDAVCAARLRAHEAIRYSIAAGAHGAVVRLEEALNLMREASTELEQGGLDVDRG